MSEENIVKIIEIISWPFFIALTITILSFIYKAPIGKLIEKLERARLWWKKGDTEFEVQQKDDGGEKSKESIEEEKITPPSLLPEIAAIQESSEASASEIKTQDELIRNMIEALNSGDLGKGGEIFNQLQAATTDPIQKLKNKGIYLSMLYRRGDTSALTQLQELTNNPDITGIIRYWIGLNYEYAGNFEKALESHKLAIQHSKTQEDRAKAVIAAAQALFSLERQSEAYELVMKELANATIPLATSMMYEGLADLYEKSKNYELQALALEKALEIEPNDTKLRFNAAYAYSKRDYRLSLLHYKILLGFRPDNATALNNIGVEYENLQMPIYAVDHFKKAKNEETIASGNLARLLTNAGFTEEAKGILDKAKEKDDVHPNVGSAISQLSKKRNAEAEAEENYLNSARKMQGFLLDFSEAYFVYQNDRPSFSGRWKSSDNIELEIVEAENSIEGKWVEKKRRFIGEIQNRATMITIKQDFLNDIQGRAYLSSNGQELFFVLFESDGEVFMTLEKVS